MGSGVVSPSLAWTWAVHAYPQPPLPLPLPDLGACEHPTNRQREALVAFPPPLCLPSPCLPYFRPRWPRLSSCVNTKKISTVREGALEGWGWVGGRGL